MKLEINGGSGLDPHAPYRSSNGYTLFTIQLSVYLHYSAKAREALVKPLFMEGV